MKLFGSGGKRSSRRSADENEILDEDRFCEPEYSDEEEYEEPDDYSGDYEDEVYNDYGETEEDVDDAIYSYKRRKRHRVAVVFAVIALILIAGAVAYSALVRPPELSQSVAATPSVTAAPPVSATADPEVEATEEPDETTEDDEYVDNGYRKEYRYTFVVVGLDNAKSNTDTILVGTLDVKEQWLHIVSIPRDTIVNVPWAVKKVNTLYASSQNKNYSSYGWGYDDGIDGLKKGLSDLMGYEPDCWAIVDLEAFEKLVDAIGGVYYDVPVDMYYNDPDQNLYINISAGYQWLSGADALKVVRFRSGYANADIGRIGTQQDFLKTVAKQMLTLGNIPNLSTVYDIYEEYVDTNLSVGNIAWFIKEFLKLDEEDITFDILPGNYSLMVGRLSYVSVDIDEWLALVNEKLSPLDKEITASDVNILTYDSTYGASATTGVVAGGANSFY